MTAHFLMLASLHWLHVAFRIDFNISQLVFKVKLALGWRQRVTGHLMSNGRGFCRRQDRNVTSCYSRPAIRILKVVVFVFFKQKKTELKSPSMACKHQALLLSLVFSVCMWPVFIIYVHVYTHSREEEDSCGCITPFLVMQCLQIRGTV